MPGYIERLRAKVGPRPVILCFACAIIRDERRHLLFQRRADFGWWGLPGGVLEVGETLAECCTREAREETGLEVEAARLVGVYSGPQYNVVYPNGDQVQQWTAAFECRVVGGQLRLDAESLEQRFFAPDALPPTSRWYADMARDALAGRPEAFFEPPRPGVRESAALANQGEYILALRRQIGSDWIVAPGAGAVIFNPAGDLLLIRRRDNGHWTIPSGYIDLGESAAEAAVRETREETGLVVAPSRLLGAYSGPELQAVYPNGDAVQICSTVFECQVTGGALRPDGLETIEAGYFPLDALPAPILTRVGKRIQELRQNRPEAWFQ
jgi:ADP-ribose pyrophosphatase YjhB (NUDIX family)